MSDNCLTCTDCAVTNCASKDKEYPDFCLTTSLSDTELDAVVDLYINNPVNKKIAQAAAEVEGEFYCTITRVQEIIEFAKKIGAKKIGIATCVGLINESRIFSKILKKNGFKVYGVACKVGAVEKKKINIGDEYIKKPGESMCNPIMQAKLLDKAQTDLNVVVGLCVGHDSLFYKYTNTITTTLITKDRVLGHNPAVALYTSNSYYKKLLE
ncbi:DUF1847 domain-containing protein [Clostridium estertheticum]|uniref:DUF1847 domain-containing protein n=1 Tax=Clostridium estertheticum TaxID=238834 RepID=UPI001C0CC90F|nr:DUF1847 domain-containing protein [Clostridium estertheticum]MBU3177712.1 DUF1847 domain-containing protein [Clostridium estertheticum]MCB2360797.1 DUF1847 domain-containing protein [Clostridium estertheticum]